MKVKVRVKITTTKDVWVEVEDKEEAIFVVDDAVIDYENGLYDPEKEGSIDFGTYATKEIETSIAPIEN